MCYISSHVSSLMYTDVCTERDKYNIDINNAKECRHSDGNSDGNSDWERATDTFVSHLHLLRY